MKRQNPFATLRRFLREQCGTVAVETVIVAPLLIVGLIYSYEYFDMYRAQSVRDKATYTMADILSRETAVVDDTYIDNAKSLFDSITDDRSANQLRISVIRYHFDPASGVDEFELRWSETRGSGVLAPLTDNDVRDAHEVFPTMVNGQDLIFVENFATYQPVVTNGLLSDVSLDTRMFMTLRFASQLCFVGTCTPG